MTEVKSENAVVATDTFDSAKVIRIGHVDSLAVEPFNNDCDVQLLIFGPGGAIAKTSDPIWCKSGGAGGDKLTTFDQSMFHNWNGLRFRNHTVGSVSTIRYVVTED